VSKRLCSVVLLTCVAVLLSAAPAQAMHITEGILPAGWAGLWFVVAAPFVFWGLHTIKRRSAAEPRYLAMVALVGAAVFVISCMPIPVPMVGTCSHPCGTGLAAVLIGPAPTVIVSSIALLFQALFMAHGGLTTLGGNILAMGIVGAYCGAFSFRFLRSLNAPVLLATFAAGLISDWATYATTSFELASALHGTSPMWQMFLVIVAAFVPTQLPLGVLEGILTALAYRFVMARRPELLLGLGHRQLVAGSCAGVNPAANTGGTL